MHLKVCDTYGFSGTAEDCILKRLLLPRGLGPPLWPDGRALVFWGDQPWVRCWVYGFSGTAEDCILKRLLLPRGLGPPLWPDGRALVFWGDQPWVRCWGLWPSLQEPALLKAHCSVTCKSAEGPAGCAGGHAQPEADGRVICSWSSGKPSALSP